MSANRKINELLKSLDGKSPVQRDIELRALADQYGSGFADQVRAELQRRLQKKADAR